MRKHLPFILFFLSLLIVGLSVYKDYGVSWDESECRIDNGILNLDFISTHNGDPLINSISKYHGPAFEMFLVGIEKAAGMKSLSDIFRMRHLVTFLFFALSVLFFYLICIKIFRSEWIALAGCAMLVLSPRIFADAFYNSKDLVFLSLIIINIYFILKLIEKKNMSTAIFSAIAAGLMIDVRIMGLMFPALLFLFLAIEFFRHEEFRHDVLRISIIYAVVFIGTTILFWPVLWINPAKHFIEAWKELSKYPWQGEVLFEGKLIKANALPWYYIPKWVLITVPPLYLALAIVGIFYTLRNFRKWTYGIAISLFLMFIPLFSLWIFKSPVYDGWRHMFFIYPAIVLLALFGLKIIFKLIPGNAKKYLSAAVVAYFASIVIVMVELHPFENVYFTSFAADSQVPIHKRYEADYWALSYKQAYEHILATDHRKLIYVYNAEEQPGRDNVLFLPEKDRKRFSITSVPELADYYVTIHRYDRKYNDFQPVFRIVKNGVVIISAYNLSSVNLKSEQVKQLMYFKNDNEHVPAEFSAHSNVETPEGKIDRVIDQTFAGNFYINADTMISVLNPDKKYANVSFRMKSDKFFRFSLILQVDSTQCYIWDSHLFEITDRGKWNDFDLKCELPSINPNEIFKVHVACLEPQTFDMDDFTVKIFSADKDSVNAIKKMIPI